MTIQTVIDEAIRAIVGTQLNAKFNIAFGFFQSYASTTQDTSGLRYCNLKLHYKTVDSQDINLLEVPILYPGSKNAFDDWTLEDGDELIVLFSDRSLEQWNNEKSPQQLNNPVRDSINHGFCIPINSHHNDFMASFPPDATVAKRINVKPGKKLQIGNTVDEVMKIHYQLITAYSAGVSLSTGLFNNQATITLLQAQLLNLTKI